MRNVRCGALALGMLVWVSSIAGAAPVLKATAEGDQINVTVDGSLFTSYKFAPSQKYPYFFPLNGPASGLSVTTETSEPYPHHRSLFFACDRVNGANYWQEGNDRGQIVSQGAKVVKIGDQVELRDKCLWRVPGQEPVMRDTRNMRITARDEGLRLIDFEITLTPLTDVTILQTNHSLFSARMAPELSVSKGGTLVNAEGQTGEKGTYGVASAWCDYFGTRDGLTEGLAILQHPQNRWYPAPWFTRDYGFISPTPMQWLENGQLELKKDTNLVLRYRVVVHAGTTEEAGIKALAVVYHQEGLPDPGSLVSDVIVVPSAGKTAVK